MMRIIRQMITMIFINNPTKRSHCTGRTTGKRIVLNLGMQQNKDEQDVCKMVTYWHKPSLNGYNPACCLVIKSEQRLYGKIGKFVCSHQLKP